jgi:hypothetical protein
MANNGYFKYALLRKVSNDVNEYPLDVNNNRTSESGLSQHTKSNDLGDPDYIVPVFDTEVCPIPTAVEYRLIAYSNTDRAEACAGTNSMLPASPISVYALAGSPLLNKTLYNYSDLTSPFLSIFTDYVYIKFYLYEYGVTPDTYYVGLLDIYGNMTSIVAC